MSLLNIVLLTIFLGYGSGGEQTNLRKLLFDTLQPILVERVEDEKRILEYCPDNLCLIIKSPSSLKPELVYEFAVLFFFYEADFPEFKKSDYLLPTGINPRDHFKNIAPDILRKSLGETCDREQNKAQCVLSCMKRIHGIHVYFSRTDEGVEIEEEL